MTSKHIVILLGAFVGLGMSMPNCPGQQAMQAQIDALTGNDAEVNKRVQALDAQTKALNADMVEAKKLLKAMSDAIQAQKGAMDQLNANLKEIQARVGSARAAAPAKGKPAAKRR